MSNKQYLLTDEEVAHFITYGYRIVEPDFPDGFNESICNELDVELAHTNPMNAILDRVPKLNQVYDHPKVRGVLVSLLGKDFRMAEHRHCHKNEPGTRSQYWHQDSSNERHHRIECVLGFYYPQDVTTDMGPTAIVPGTHFRNAPSDRMAAYGNFREQVVTTVKAGTVVFAHYDVWHAATANTSNKIRYMLKFLFNRGSEPRIPSWNHNPQEIDKAMEVFGNKVCDVAQSDHYKEGGLRREMWNHLIGNSSSLAQ